MSYLKNTWYVAMWAQDLPADKLVGRTITEQPLVLFRDPHGDPVAMLDRCPHRFAPLQLGTLCDRGQKIKCGYHGLEFDTSGTCVHNPHSQTIPAAARVPVFKAVQRHSLIWVWMGDKQAQPDLIPDYSAFDESNNERVSRRETIELEVNYQLMTDNLLDLSHVSFLHDGVLGHSGMVQGQIKVDREGDTLYVKRATPEVAPPGMFDLLYKRDGQPVDVWADMRWNAPACMLNNAGVCPPGAARDTGVWILGAHILTPISQFRSQYHFAAVRYDDAVVRNAEQQSEVMEKLSALRRYAFEEQDEPMVLAQQTAQLAAGGLGTLKPVLLSIDVGPVQARRMMDEFRTTADSQPAAVRQS